VALYIGAIVMPRTAKQAYGITLNSF
jgi:hypothetical protein